MSSRELIESLRSAADEKLNLIRQEAEREVEALRADARRGLEEERAQYAERLSRESAEETRRACADAGARARMLKLSAEQQVSERLMSIARASLAGMRGTGYSDVFEKLVRELPDFPWKQVMVNPGDHDLARQHFPGVEIALVETVSGGMEASTEDGTVRVVNTFEKRLERAWEDLLPLLVEDVYREAADGASPEPR